MSIRMGLLHAAILLLRLSPCALLLLSVTNASAQSPVDLYQPGPDPIAPALPTAATATA